MKHICVLEFERMKQFHNMTKIKLSLTLILQIKLLCISFTFMHVYRMNKQNHTSKNVSKKSIFISKQK